MYIMYIMLMYIMPQREVRKVITNGTSSLAVIIPKPWMDYFGLKAGDEIEVITNGNVTITPLGKKKRKPEPTQAS